MRYFLPFIFVMALAVFPAVSFAESQIPAPVVPVVQMSPDEVPISVLNVPTVDEMREDEGRAYVASGAPGELKRPEAKDVTVETMISPAGPVSKVKKGDRDALPKSQIVLKTKMGQSFIFDVEMAMGSKSHASGLMHRKSLAEDAGMLFIFNALRPRSFWMKDTLIPLDILFLEPDGRIHHIHHNARPQNTALITALKPAQAVLEINGGLADQLGISEGDTVYHPVFRNVLGE